MRIGIGISKIHASTGIGATQRALLGGLAHLNDHHEFILFGTRADLKAVSVMSHFEQRVIDSCGLRATVEAEKLDLFHGLAYYIPLTRSCSTVVTTHDTLLLENVDRLPERWIATPKKMIPLCAQWANRVITVSQDAQEKVVVGLNIPRQKIDVIYNGIASEFMCLMDLDNARNDIRRLGIPSPYLLYVGRVAPRKNLKTLIAAFDLLRQEHPGPVTLVIVNGLTGKSLMEGLDHLFTPYPEIYPGNWNGYTCWSQHVIVTGPLSTSELVSLYNLATIFVYPSLAEGFGLPPIEAMSCGVPVIASNRPSMPEIVGEAALLVDPLDLQQFISAIRQLLNDPQLAARMRERGLERAKRYSQQKMALDTLKVYQKALFL